MANGTAQPSPNEDARGTERRAEPAGSGPGPGRSESRKGLLTVRKRVGGYVVGETVGEGSFGKVRLAVHSLTGETVAMKILDKKLIAKREYVRKNLRREAAVLQRLASHPNIIRLYEVLETANNYYLVTELAQGGPFMRHLCDRRRLTERETRKYMRQLVSAVDYMHQAQVVHRDIKIENFLLDEDCNLKVIDFGLSNILGHDALLKTQCGSPAYAAPEIFSNSSYGPAVDVWSIGVNMFAMLTGELPFTVDPPTNMTKLHAKIMEGCSIPQHLTRDCRDLLDRLLTADVAQRISLRDVMRHPWINRGYTRRLFPAPYPGRPAEGQLDRDVVASLVAGGLDEGTLRAAVVQNRPVAETAAYHLLRSRLTKGMGYPEGRAPPTTSDCNNNNINHLDGDGGGGANGDDDDKGRGGGGGGGGVGGGGGNNDDAIDLASDSLILSPPAPSPVAVPSPSVTPSGKPASQTGPRRSHGNKAEPHRTPLADKHRTAVQETRLKSAPAPARPLSGRILVDARRQRPDTVQTVTATTPTPQPTRELILEDMRRRLHHPTAHEGDINGEMQTSHPDKGPLIVITSLDDNATSADGASDRDVPVTPAGIGASEPRSTPTGLGDPKPGRIAAVERGCMIIVNGRLAKGSLLTDALGHHPQHHRSAWMDEPASVQAECETLPRRLGLRRSRTDPGTRSSSSRPGERDDRTRTGQLAQPGDQGSPYQNHSAFPAHRLGLYYSVNNQLRHYPGTRTQRQEPAKRGCPAPRARSHTAPNGRPLLSLKGAQVRSAPQALAMTSSSAGARAGARAPGGNDLTLPRIHVGRTGRH